MTPNQMLSATAAVNAVRSVFPECDDLRREPWKGSNHPSAGHCYVACEAVMHIADERLYPYVMRVGSNPLDLLGETRHWFLKDEYGHVYDPTFDQFSFPLDYSRGRRNGMMRPWQPSVRAQEMMRWIGICPECGGSGLGETDDCGECGGVGTWTPPSPAREIPYPPVFRDWKNPEQRVGTVRDSVGVGVDMFQPANGTWRMVILTEDDACLMAASLLEKAGEPDLAKKVLTR